MQQFETCTFSNVRTSLRGVHKAACVLSVFLISWQSYVPPVLYPWSLRCQSKTFTRKNCRGWGVSVNPTLVWIWLLWSRHRPFFLLLKQGRSLCMRSFVFMASCKLYGVLKLLLCCVCLPPLLKSKPLYIINVLPFYRYNVTLCSFFKRQLYFLSMFIAFNVIWIHL